MSEYYVEQTGTVKAFQLTLENRWLLKSWPSWMIEKLLTYDNPAGTIMLTTDETLALQIHKEVIKIKPRDWIVCDFLKNLIVVEDEVFKANYKLVPKKKNVGVLFIDPPTLESK